MSFTRKLVIGIIILAAAIQLYRPARTNPPVDPSLGFDAGGRVPADVASIVKRSCYDCHSNATTWPWYSQVAPMSWMVADHVAEGREALNFTEWQGYDVKRQVRRLADLCDEVERGGMPLASYLLLHRDARLSASDVQALCTWTAAESGRLTASGATIPPFAPAASHGDLVYVSGILPAPDAGDGIGPQAASVVAELSRRLAQAGTSLDRVVSTSVYLKRAGDFAGMNDVWRSSWPSRPPTRTTIVADLPSSAALIQISAIAAKPGVNVEAVLPAGWPPSSNPYSYAIRVGDTLFLSGLVPRNPRDGSPVTGDISVQTKAVLDSAAELLQAAGLSFRNVVGSRVFIANVSDFQAMNAAYRPYFGDAPPSRATVRATLTNPDFLIEVTLTAAAGGTRLVYTTPGEDGSAGQSNPNLSSAIGIGPRIFLSGMLGVRPDSTGDGVAQANEALGRLERTMALGGAGWPNVVDSVVYVTDMSKAAPIVDAMRTRAGGRLPVGAVVGAGLVSPDGLVEITLTTGK